MSHQILMIGTEIGPQTFVIFNQLTQLIAREDFINISRRESFKLYVIILSCFEPYCNLFIFYVLTGI
jgi:hypothetical protein